MDALAWPTAGAEIDSRDSWWTPLHFTTCYRPNYEGNDAGDLEEAAEKRVTNPSMASSKQAVMYLIEKCKIDVSYVYTYSGQCSPKYGAIANLRILH